MVTNWYTYGSKINYETDGIRIQNDTCMYQQPPSLLEGGRGLNVCQYFGISRWKVDKKTHKVYKNILAKVI